MKNNIVNIFFVILISIFYSCQKKQQPNILFIMSDDHTSQAWGIYGGILKDYVKNPNIERLAESGIVLNNAFCTNSICVPSRASILTGQYSHKNGVYTLADELTPDSMNVAKILQGNNYQTAIIGKWHLKKEPTGFDYYMVLPDQGLYWDPFFKTKDNWQDGNKGGKRYKGFSTDIIADKSIEWLKQRDKTKPFFLMTHFKATHEPFDYPDRHKDLYKNIEIPYPETFLDRGAETTGRTFDGQSLENLGKRYIAASKGPWWCQYPNLPFSVKGLDSIQARKKIYQKFVKDFMRCGATIDDNIGKLLDYLQKEEIAENTVVIYTADQGYFLGEHGFFDKRLIYEESLRMPFVICYPKEIKGGQRLDDLILNIDFASLFLDYGGIKQPNSMQGRSFRKNLNGNTPKDWRKSVYYRYWTNEKFRPAHFGVRTDRYKLALFYGQAMDTKKRDQMPYPPGWEFYDLKEDPNETNNAINNPRYRKIIKELKKELIKLKDEYGDSDEKHPIIHKIIEKNWNN